MRHTLIILHTPEHRRRALSTERNTREAQEAYDRCIGDYFEFLRKEAAAQGWELRTDNRDMNALITIDEIDHDQKKVVHAWLLTLPDIWNWMP